MKPIARAQWLRGVALAVIILVIAWGALFVLGFSGIHTHTVRQVFDPPELENHKSLEARRQAQLATVGDFKAYVNFGFTDRLAESGITFKHGTVDDVGKDYKAVHYDHGNGICVADVDGDGRPDVFFANQVGGNELWRNLGDGKFENITESAGVAMAGRVNTGCAFADIDNDGCPDLYVTTVLAGNALFKNDCKGRFTDISASSGLGYVGHSSGAIFFDFNGDGLLDVFLANVGDYTTMNHVMSTTADGKPYEYYVGRTDAFEGHLHSDRNEQSRLFQNLGDGHFKDVTEAMGIGYTGWTGDASIVVNDERWPDLYVLNMQGNNHFYKNMRGKSFVDQTDATFSKTPWGAMGVKSFDWNNDGRMDLFVTDMHSDMSYVTDPADEKKKSTIRWDESFLRSNGKSIYGNAFFEKKSDGGYQEISDRIGAENFWPWGPSVGDLNADGFQDVFIASGMGYPFRYGINSVLINEGGQRFRDAEFILGVEPRPSEQISTHWFDMDCEEPRYASDPNATAVSRAFTFVRFYARNGLVSLFPSLRDRFGPFLPFDCEGLEGPISVTAARSTRSAAVFDVDDDGDLDIVTNDFNTPPMVLISNLAQQKGQSLHFLKVRLEGSAGRAKPSELASNREGIGARVIVKAGGNSYTQVMDGKSGYLSQSDLPLYFGLGDATHIDSIEVHWPSGRTQTVNSPIKMNSLLAIQEPGASR